MSTPHQGAVARSLFHPTFNSTSLNQAIFAVNPILEKYQDALNKLTEDILGVEKYLHSTGVVFPVELRVPELDESVWIEGNDSAKGHRQPGLYFLRWQQVGPGGKCRLFFSLEYGDTVDEEIFLEVYKSGPLAEANVERKLAAAPHLGKFLHEVGDTINRVYLSKWYSKKSK